MPTSTRSPTASSWPTGSTACSRATLPSTAYRQSAAICTHVSPQYRAHTIIIYTQLRTFLGRYSWEVHYPLDFQLMNEAAQMLVGERDFKCFCKAGADVKTTICNVTDAHFERIDGNFAEDRGDRHLFVITANRFLRNMVRAVVGTLVDVGRGRITLDDFQRILETGSRSDAGERTTGMHCSSLTSNIDNNSITGKTVLPTVVPPQHKILNDSP